MTTPLEERRRRLGLTQEELAKRAGVSKTTIVDLENGKTKHAREGTLNVIAKALGVAADKLRPRATRGPEPAQLKRGDRGRSLVQTTTLGSEPRDATPLQAGAQRDADSESVGTAPNHLLPNDLFPDHHAAWRDPDWPQDELVYPDGPPRVEKERPQGEGRWLAFEMLARGQLSFHELEALVFVALVQHFRNAADAYALHPEEYEGRVRAMQQVLTDAEHLGRSFWYARDREPTHAFLMLAPPSEAELAELEAVLWRWVMVHGAKIGEWAGAGPWWDPKLDPMIIVRLLEEVGGLPISSEHQSAASGENHS